MVNQRNRTIKFAMNALPVLWPIALLCTFTLMVKEDGSSIAKILVLAN